MTAAAGGLKITGIGYGTGTHSDGMDIVKRIVGEARKWLTEDGVLVVEIGNERANVEATLGGLDIVWLSTSAGDDNVFLIQASDLPG